MTLTIDAETKPKLVTDAGRHVAVWGSSGSGKSSVAVNLSCELADLGHTVLLIDADSYHPSLAALLGVVSPGPGITALLRLARANRLTVEELHRLGHEVNLGSRGLWLVTGMNNPSRWPELDSEALIGLANFAQAQFDFVVWDIATHLEQDSIGGPSGQMRNQASSTILSLAEVVLGLFLADPVGINRFLFDSRLVGREFMAVGNRVRPTVLGRKPERQILDGLYQLAKLKVEQLISEDQGFDEQLRTIKPLMLQPKKPRAREQIRQLAHEIIDRASG